MVTTDSQQDNNKTNNFSSVEWLTNQAIKKHKEGQIEEAIAYYLELIELDSKQSPEVYLRLVNLMLEVNNLSGGKKIAQAAFALHPKSKEIHHLLKNLFSDKDSHPDQTDQIIKQIHIEGPLKYQANNLQGALECYLKAVSLDPYSPEWIYGSAIIIAAKLGQLEEALKLGTKSLSIYPNSDEINRAVGIAFEIKEDLESSIEHYTKAIQLNHNQPQWLTAKLADHLESMSLKNHQQGNVMQARKLFKKSTEVKQQTQVTHQQINSIKFPPLDDMNAEKCLKGAVVSWDMSHNPAGRSFLLADMAKVHFDIELIGPIFTFYGQEIWSPIANQDVEMSTFDTSTFEDFIKGAIKLAKAKKYDFVYVSKARFPSLFIGMLIKHYSQCPLILDVDDHELSFFKNKPLAEFEELVASPRDQEWYKPYSEIWTRFSESLISTADALTVSNIALQQRFGGIIVRHARDEQIFNPQLYNRTAIRSQFGYQEQDRVILFLGTPRPHKGIFHIAQALDNLKDPDLALCIIGTINDKRVANKFAEYKNARIDFHENQPWERLPELVSMADLICILQDPNSPIADYQIPAKLTDAMAMGVPMMVTKVPPLQDLIASKSVIAVEQDNLETAIKEFFQNKHAKILEHSRERYTYLGEFTYGVNSERIKQTLAKAKRNYKPFPEIYTKIFDLVSIESGIKILDGEPSKKVQNTLPKQQISINRDEPFNVLFFWKQNDSDLYGRRQDMIAKYLANSDCVNKVIHFDAPISAGSLQEMVQHGPKAKFSQNNLVFTNTVDRFLGLKDTKKIIKRTFVYRDSNSGEKFLGRVLPKKSDYPNFVRQVIKEAGIGRNTVAWVCPVNFEFPELHQELNFGCVIADIIDDQRQWDVKPQYLVRLSENYQQILENADLTFTNCEPVKDSFQELNSQIEVIPNGSELFTQTDSWSKPEFLAGLKGPIIGYVGNLSDRIDIELLKYIAVQNPDWNIIMIGSAHGSAQIFELVKYANIHLLGVKPYNEAVKFIRYFDVAMVPHINNKLTKNMNCLKLYVYFSVGIPIVTTEIANIKEFAGSIYVAKNREDFNQGIKKILEGKGINPNVQKRQQLLNEIDWENKVSSFLARIKRYFENNSLPKDSNQFSLSTVFDYSEDKSKTSDSKSNSLLPQSTSRLTQSDSLQKTKLSYSSLCSLCGTQQTFQKNHNSLREGYKCTSCKASLRYRAQAEAIVSIYGINEVRTLENLCKKPKFKKLAIYEPHLNSPFVKYFSKFDKYERSWHWDDVPLGSYKDNIKCQNLSQLLYEQNSFDLVISSDIMDLCRKPLQVFKEIWRVIKPGGYYVFTIPTLKPMPERTVFRVDTNNEKDNFLLSPVYRKNCLVYIEFGNSFIEEIRNIGFNVEVHSPSLKHHEISKLLTFVLRKD